MILIWKQLLASALKLLANTPIEASQWRFGGGTVLMLRYQHRLSRDVDIFFTDPQLKGYITPRLNDALEDELGDYLEADFYTRFILEQGKIDFIFVAPVTDDFPEKFSFEGTDLYLDSSLEIVGKKIRYRSDAFKSRDIFDLAVVLKFEGEDSLMAFCREHPDRTREAYEITARLNNSGALQMDLEQMDLLPEGKRIADSCHDVVLDFFQRALGLSTKPSP